MINFLWDNKLDNISKDISIQDYSHGELKMIDIEILFHSLKFSWIKRIKFQPDSKCLQVYETMLNTCTYGKQFDFK